MTTHVRYNATTLVAGADLSGADKPYKAVAVGGTIAATGATAFGLLLNKPRANEHATVAYEGELKAWAGAAISAGALLTVTTSGFIITTPASGTASSCVGRALEAANSGDLFRGLFNFMNAV